MIFKKIANALSTVVIVLLVLVLLFNLALYAKRQKTGEQCPTVFGLGLAVVVSGSMEPEIKVGDLVVIYEKEDYNVREVITFEGETKPVTHRIVSKRIDQNGTAWYTTQGDVNNTDDGEISQDHVIGKIVLVIPAIGDLQGFLQTPLGFLILISIVIVILILCELPNMINSFRSKLRRRRR